MFLIRLVYLKSIKNETEKFQENQGLEENKTNIFNEKSITKTINNSTDLFDLKNKTVGQIKNVIQEKQKNQTTIEETKASHVEIKSFTDLIKICDLKKEVKLKYELEKNVNLVNFEKERIEISFNDDLDKEFIKILSSKLFEWTRKRWIITLSQNQGKPSIKQEEINLKKELMDKTKNGESYKKILETFSDAELIDIKIEEKKDD